LPYKLRGKCVYKKTSKGWVKKGCSTTVSKAKDYLKALNMRHAGVPPKEKK